MEIRIALFILCLLPFSATAYEEGDIFGVWKTEDDGDIDIRPCGEHLCGYIIDHDTDEESHRLNGHRLLEGYRYLGDGVWKGGKIHNPRGGTFNGALSLLDSGRLKIRGCLVWPLCGSRVWTRVP